MAHSKNPFSGPAPLLLVAALLIGAAAGGLDHYLQLRAHQQAAEAADADTPMGQAATELYRTFVEEEDGKGRDFSAMLPRFEKRHRG